MIYEFNQESEKKMPLGTLILHAIKIWTQGMKSHPFI